MDLATASEIVTLCFVSLNLTCIYTKKSWISWIDNRKKNAKRYWNRWKTQEFTDAYICSSKCFFFFFQFLTHSYYDHCSNERRQPNVGNVLKGCSPQPPDWMFQKKKVHGPSQPVQPQPTTSQKHPSYLWKFASPILAHWLLLNLNLPNANLKTILNLGLS